MFLQLVVNMESVFPDSESAVCKCPFEFTTGATSKCLVPYVEECESGSSMLTYKHTFLYGIYPPKGLVTQTSLQQCQSLCLNDELCTAVTFTNDGTSQCRMKKTQHITGYSDPSLSSVSFVKKCSDPLAADPNFPISSPPHSPLKPSYKICIPCLIGSALGTFFVFAAIQCGIGFYICKRRILMRKKAALAYTYPNSKGLIVLSFTEIYDLTGNFQNKIGPKTFKGMLPSKQPVAIKDVKSTIEERKFRGAVLKIGSIHHKNLVKLLGYCSELGHKYLVYEYVKNGSLEKYIQDSKLSKMLNWRKRVEICSTVARAICYLHTGCREFISHGNLKCENVVLDENLDAMVTEFGLGRLYGEASSDADSAEKDVKDFGKMVLILISGCQVVEDVGEWAYKEWIQGQADNVIDKRVDDDVDLQELDRVLRITFWCLHNDERMRPTMAEVVKVLEGTLMVDLLSSPFTNREPPEEVESSESCLEP